MRRRRSPSPSSRLFLLLTSVLLLPAVGSGSQTTIALGGVALGGVEPGGTPALAAPPDASFSESLDVAVTDVEVFVTDRDGNPVPGLDRSAFQLFEDGKPVEIVNFYAEQGAPVETAELSTLDPAAPAKAPAPTAAISERQRLHLAVFVDQSNLSIGNQRRLLASLQKALASWAPRTDRLLLATYDTSFRLVEAPTGDPARLATAVGRLAAGRNRPPQAAADLRRILNDLAKGPALHDGSEQNDANVAQIANEVYLSIKLYGQARDHETRTTAAALSGFIDTLAGLPGRKALLYVGGGLVLEPEQALMHAWLDKWRPLVDVLGINDTDAPQLDRAAVLNKIADRANAAGVTVYALGEPEATQGISADVALDVSWNATLESADTLQRTQTLTELAADTGGYASLNSAQAPALLARVRRDLDSYYSLGFTPHQARDGKEHRLKVVVKGDGLEVRYRDRYRALSDGERLIARARAALLFGAGDNPYGVAVEFGSGEPHGDRAWTVPVLVKFPMARLSLLPHDKLQEGRMRLFIGARDDRGRLSKISEIAVPVRVLNDQLASSLEKLGACQVKLDMRPGANQVVVALWDEVAREESIVTVGHTVGGGSSR